MLLLPPVEPTYDETYPAVAAVSFEPPRAFVEDYWDWDRKIAGPHVSVRSARLIPTLRAVAARRDAERALVDSALARVQAARARETSGPTIELSNAMADLAVTGRAAYRQFRALAPTEDSLLAATMSPPRRVFTRPLTEREVRAALRGTLDRAYRVVWALTAAPEHRAELRGSLGWIAVSPEDDAPHSPVNIGGAADPVGEINFAEMGQPISCRVSIKLGGALPALPSPGESIRTFPTEAYQQFQQLLSHRRDHYDDLILFIHGLGSRIEEGDRFKQRLIDHGRARGKRYAVLSLDLPGFGYSSRLTFDAVVRGRPARFDIARPSSRSSFPFLTLYRECLAQLSNRIAGGFQYVVGGSLGGNLTLRLAEARNDRTHILPDTIRKFLSWSPASIWESYERSRLVVDPNGGTHYDHVKHEMVRQSRDSMNELEKPESRHAWFDWIQRGTKVWGPFRAGGWVGKADLSKDTLLYLTEMYGPEWRRTFWATSHEQLIFSHQEPLARRDQWNFKTINRPLYIISGEKDVNIPLDYFNNVDKVTKACPDVPGRRMLLRRTGHSVHEERPDLLASHAVRFFTDAPTFRPGSEVTVVSRGEERLDILATGGDERVYHNSWHGGVHHWSSHLDSWQSIGGWFPQPAPITAVSRRNTMIDAFGIANDGRVYTSWFTDGVSDWSGVNDAWRNVGGVFPSGARVSAVARKPGQLDLFVVGGDGRAYTSWWTEGVTDWSGIGDRWRNVGGTFPPGAPVSALARKSGQLDLFVVGRDGRVHTSWWTEGVTDWSGIRDRWRDIGGRFPTGAPVSAVARKSGQLDLFAVGRDGRVYTSWWTDGVTDWSGIGDRWRNIGGTFPAGAPVSAVARKSGQLDLFVVGGDGRVYTSWWTDGVSDWSGIGDRWRNIGGTFPAGAPVSAVARKPSQLDLFVVGNDGHIYTSWWTERGADWSGIGDRWQRL